MLKFLDGPAAGVSLSCSRAPLFLRVVGKAGKWDALDQLDDTPAADEAIHVYRKTEDHGMVHYCGRDKNGKRFGRTEEYSVYAIHSAQPDDATARDNSRWAEWAKAEYERMKEA